MSDDLLDIFDGFDDDLIDETFDPQISGYEQSIVNSKDDIILEDSITNSDKLKSFQTHEVLGNSDINQTKLLVRRPVVCQEQVMRRRVGYSRLTTANDFKRTYLSFIEKNKDIFNPDEVPTVDLTVKERLSVEPPLTLIKAATEREVQQYKLLLAAANNRTKINNINLFELFPQLTASVPSIVDLEEPMASAKKERLMAMLYKPYKPHLNAQDYKTLVEDVMESKRFTDLLDKVGNIEIEITKDREIPSQLGKLPNPTSLADSLNPSNPLNIQNTHFSTNTVNSEENDVKSLKLSPLSLPPIYSPLEPPKPLVNEVILRVHVYDNKTQNKIHEMLVLGSQPLSVIRDAINCSTDDWDAQMNGIPIELCHARHMTPPTIPIDNDKTTNLALGMDDTDNRDIFAEIEENDVNQAKSGKTSKNSSHDGKSYTPSHCSHGVLYNSLTSPSPPPQLIPEPPTTASIYLNNLRHKIKGRPLHPPCLSLPHPSGFFFIEDVFYDDLRAPHASRISDPIVSWAKQKDRQSMPTIGVYSQKSMETKLLHIPLRLGSHYLYQHQGECRHTIVFSDLRMAEPTVDVNDMRHYPIMVFSPPIKSPKCCTCDTYLASSMTFDDRLAAGGVGVWCRKCFVAVHMDHDGNMFNPNTRIYPILPLVNYESDKYIVIHT